ncbi:MAG: hypothetical protein E6I37_16560 [Chloroflexi bacterium]|nr:MAG: hypothetical protein E6I37_16560 [Chloroflexota bacterium]
MRQAGSWRPDDAQLGWIIENRVDEAYILSWPGQLETYVPLHDTGGFDRARAPLGSYDFRLDQIKGTASVYLKNQIEIGFTTPTLHPNRNLDFTFVDYLLPTRELIDPAWLVPSDKLAEVCSATGTGGSREPRWLFTADRSGLARDRAAKYQVALRELAAARRWSILPRKSAAVGVSANPIETGMFFERHFDATFLEAASGDEVLMASAPDNFSRHRLAFSKESGRWASIAIHGSAASNSSNLIQANIHAATFFPHPRHYILVQHYDRRRAEWYPWSWFIPSTDFARLAAGKGPYLLFTTTLNPQRVNRWLPYRIATASAATAFQAALHHPASRRAA